MSIIVMLNEKFRERVQGAWEFVTSDSDRFGHFFHRALELQINHENHGLDLRIRRFLLIFTIHAFQSLEQSVVRSECLRLVTISMWKCLASESALERVLSSSTQLRKVWNKAEKKASQMGEWLVHGLP